MSLSKNRRPAPPTANLYVAAFTINPSDGALTPVSGSPIGIGVYATGISPLMIEPTGKFLYIAYGDLGNSTNDVAGFSIDPTTGALTVIASTPEVGTSITFDPSGNFAYGVFNYAITAYGVDAKTGGLTALPGSPYFSSMFDIGGPVVMDPSGNFAYLLTINSGILVLRIDPSTHALTLVPGSSVGIPDATSDVS
jgi:hypothetical protein